MKRLLPLLGLLLAYVNPAQAISYAGNKASIANAGGGQQAQATITSQTAGNTNIVGVLWCDDNSCTSNNCSGDTVSVSDAANGSYGTVDVRLNSSVNRKECLAVFHLSNITTSASNAVTATISGSSAFYATIAISEWSGLTNTAPADQSGTVDLGSTASPLSITAGGATAQASELVYAFGAINAGTLAAGSSYSALNAPVTNILDEYQIVSSISTYTATETYTGSTGQCGILVTFKGASGASGGGGFGGKTGIGGKGGFGYWHPMQKRRE